MATSATPSSSSSSSSMPTLPMLDFPLEQQELRRDWGLEWSLGPILSEVPRPAWEKDHVKNPIAEDAKRAVFLTGATGFLGPMLAKELLLAFPNHDVLCLVRGQDEGDANERLRRVFADAGQALDEAALSRCHAVLGDLVLRRFGLSDSAWKSLAARCDCVVHSAAQVNHALPYAALRAANVQGTEEVLKFALSCHQKPSFHFVSSTSALSTRQVSSEVVDNLSEDQMRDRDGYGQTKVVSERQLKAAAERLGLPVSIYRPSVICGNAEHGNIHDVENHLLRAIVLSGRAVTRTSYSLGWISVDAVAQSVAKIAASEGGRQSGCHCYHLNGIGPTLPDVVSVLQQDLGYQIRPIATSLWKTCVKKIPNDKYLEHYRSTLMDLTFPDQHLTNVTHSNDRLRAALRAIDKEVAQNVEIELREGPNRATIAALLTQLQRLELPGVGYFLVPELAKMGGICEDEEEDENDDDAGS
mmetsp:Transcript_33573/g.72759  ORF Transcript_33573/g.72759 Transcript_33573/m.72759 type:complete len:471 (-) Transcript_33573:176-1588(-)